MTDTEPPETTGEPPPPAEAADVQFAANLREERERRRISKAEFARRMRELGHSWFPQTVQKIEAGHRKVRVGEAEAVARILGTSMDRLTWPTQVASAAWLLDTAMARAQKSWNDIARRTATLLWALGQLQTAVTEMEDRDCLGSGEIRKLVTEAALFLEMNPEDAVEAGRGDFGSFLPGELEHRIAEEEAEEAARRAAG
jgi:transcriptional regulator with XRE-family HTH domain